MSKISIRSCAEHIAARSDFDCYGALRGSNLVNGYISAGRLPEPHRSEFYKNLPYMARPGSLNRHILYIVWSYETPIAWFTKADGWVIPDAKYSVTTSKHQNVVRRAVA